MVKGFFAYVGSGKSAYWERVAPCSKCGKNIYFVYPNNTLEEVIKADLKMRKAIDIIKEN